MKHVPEVITIFAAKRASGAAISAITLAELEYGVCKSNDYEKNKNKLIGFLALTELLPFDDSAALAYGDLRASLQKKGTPIGPMDMLIAAHAKSKGLIVVTNNIREFERIPGLKTENWAKG